MFSKTQQEIMHSWDDTTPLVSICCTTYDHENYITDAIEGFLSQETTFPFEILIRDDFSTDSTALIIKKFQKQYPKLIFPIFETENTYSKGIKPMPVLYKKAKGKYIALCEGDDYWIDPLKLAKQVEFLEDNLDYSFCGTRYMATNSTYALSEVGLYTLNEILLDNRFGTLTVMFRRQHLCNTFFDYIKKMPIGDWPLWVFLSMYGNGIVLDHITANYRVHSAGIYSNKDKISQYLLKLNVIEKLDKSSISVHLEKKILRKSWRKNLYRILKIIPSKSSAINTVKSTIKSSLYLTNKEKIKLINLANSHIKLAFIYSFFLRYRK